MIKIIQSSLDRKQYRINCVLIKKCARTAKLAKYAR